MSTPNEPAIPLDTPWYRAPFFARLIVLVCPPLGLWLVWRDPMETRARRIMTVLVALVWMVPYTLGLLALGVLTGLFALEFQGGWGPSLVRRPTVPNFGLVEDSRREQRNAPAPTAGATNALQALRPYWTDFRGPRRDGRYDERPLLTEWSMDGIPRLWRQPCGGGYASFVVAAGLAYTIEQRWDKEAIVAYELDTGREVWVREYAAKFTEWMGGDGPRATPTIHDGFVFSLGAQGEVRAISLGEGTGLWERNILTETGAENLQWGLAAAPIIVDKALVVLNGNGTASQSVVAFDYLSGRQLWSALSDRMTYTSPLLAELAGRQQLVLVTASRVLGLGIDARHDVLWEVPWTVPYDAACAMPVVVGTNRLFVSAGYGAGAALLEIQRSGNTFKAETVWRNRNLKNKFNASVLWQDHLYGLDEGVLACVNVVTGDQVWRDGRYGYGQLLLADGHLIIVAADGQLALVEATPAGFRERGRVRAVNGKTWNVPALAHGRLLVRNAAEMTCFDLRRRRNDNVAP